MNEYQKTAAKIGNLVSTKNKQYGNSFIKSGEILKIIYPNGVKPEQYCNMLVVARILDKICRISHGNQGQENAYQDIAGYGLLMTTETKNENK